MKERSGGARTAWAEYAEAVGDEDAGVVGIEAGLCGEDVVGGVRDEHRVVAGVEGAVLLDEVEQVRHLFEVRGDVGIVACEVHVVEFDVHHMLDFSGGRVQLTLSLKRRGEPDGKQPATKRGHKEVTKPLCTKHLRFLLY